MFTFVNSIYGGPFLHFIEGEIDYENIITTDIEQESEIGGFFGLNTEITESYRVTALQISDYATVSTSSLPGVSPSAVSTVCI
jgi:hypothetical protein